MRLVLRNRSLAVLALAALGAQSTAAAGTHVVAWGDSITYGYYDGTSAANDCTFTACPPSGCPSNNAPEVCGYSGRLRGRLDNASLFSPIYDVSLLNLGAGGEKTTAALSRMDRVSWTCPCAALATPCPINSLKYWYCNGTLQPEDLLVLLEGTNDITTKVSVETIRTNLQNLGLKAEALGLNVVISTLTERHPYACVDPDNSVVETLNGEIDTVASAQGWPLNEAYTRLSLFANLYANHYQDWDPMKCDPANSSGVGDPVGHLKRSGYDKLTFEAAAVNYPLTLEYTVRGALPPRLLLTTPTPPLAHGVSLPFSVALPDVAFFGQTVGLTWDFGDGAVVSQNASSSPVARNHTYAESGRYTVVVTAEHANGGTRATSAVLDVDVLFIDGFDAGGTSNWSVGG